MLRDKTPVELPRQIFSYVIQDEARHVAFGRLALRDYYRNLSDAERAEREEFIAEGCFLMRERLNASEMWANLGIDPVRAREVNDGSRFMQTFRKLLFSRIVPCVKDIGLWGPTIRNAYTKLGVLDLADVDLDVLMAEDSDIADAVDRERAEAVQAAEDARLAARKAEVEATIASGMSMAGS
jgi:hypothetical protein